LRQLLTPRVNITPNYISTGDLESWTNLTISAISWTGGNANGVVKIINVNINIYSTYPY
jgi:hypothetical protein